MFQINSLGILEKLLDVRSRNVLQVTNSIVISDSVVRITSRE